MAEYKKLAPEDLTPDGYPVRLQGERRKGLLRSKCKTPGCWHHKESNGVYTLCICCLHERCRPFTEEEKALYLEKGVN